MATISRGTIHRSMTWKIAEQMSTFALIHGGGDVGWYWHLVETELRGRGRDVVAHAFSNE